MYLQVIDYFECFQVSQILIRPFRAVVPEIFLFDFLQLVGMLLLGSLCLLLAMLLVGNQLILITSICLRVFGRALFVDGRHTLQVVQLQEFQRLLINLLVYLTIDIALLLDRHCFVVELCLLFHCDFRMLLRLLLFRFCVCGLCLQFFYFREVVMLQDLRLVFDFDFQDTLLVLLVVLLTGGI